MGLDMYLYGIKGTESKSIAYWRKHRQLHGWMENRWKAKGLQSGAEDFNLRPFELNRKDLMDLKRAVSKNELPDTSGFLFGNSVPDEDTKREDLSYIKDALDALKEGYTIIYNSWW